VAVWSRSKDIRRSSRRVLLLAPSEGLGGGIERYVRGVEAALSEEKVDYVRMNVPSSDNGRPTLLNKAAFVVKVMKFLYSHPQPTRLVVAHTGLLPVSILARKAPAYDGTVFIHYGAEVWGPRKAPGRRFAKRDDCRAITISAFSGGALQRDMPATVVSPVIDRDWYEMLVAAGERSTHGLTGARLSALMVFRLEDWKSKGLPTVVRAVESLGLPIQLTVIGSGQASEELVDFVSKRPWVQLKRALLDEELADEYATADIAILATRTRSGKTPSGEGFGLCLVEAQLAGTAVIAPAYGGSHDTFLNGVTGLSPVDESAGALGSVLSEIAKDSAMRDEMSRAAANWSRSSFDPSIRAKALVEALVSPIRNSDD
jgi:phosphatidylinositol alpha-1,6-mannosyltransferase